MKNTNEHPQIVFEREGGVDIAAAVRAFEVDRYRTRIFNAGPLRDIEAYPVFKTKKEATRANKAEKTNKAQANENDRHARLYMDRIVALNFREHVDLKIGLDFFEEPKTIEKAKDAIAAWVRKYRKEGKLRGVEIKVFYITPWLTKTGKITKRLHFHLVVTACGMSMYELVELWPHGRTFVVPLQPDKNGVLGLSCYLKQHLHGSKHWSGTRNLIKPEPEYPREPLRKTQASKLAVDFELARSYFEEKNPEHIFIGMEVRISEFVSGAYLLVRMRLRSAWVGKTPIEKWEGVVKDANLQGVRRGNRVRTHGNGEQDARAAGSD